MGPQIPSSNISSSQELGLWFLEETNLLLRTTDWFAVLGPEIDEIKVVYL